MIAAIRKEFKKDPEMQETWDYYVLLQRGGANLIRNGIDFSMHSIRAVALYFLFAIGG